MWAMDHHISIAHRSLDYLSAAHTAFRPSNVMTDGQHDVGRICRDIAAHTLGE